MKTGKKRFRSVMCTVLAFLLALSMTLIGILCVAKLTVMNPNYLIRIYRASDYAKEIHSELKEELISYGSACNVDASFFDGVFDTIITEQLIEDYTANSVTDLYNGTEKVSDLSELDAKLFEALKVYAVDKGFEIDNTLEDNLKNMSSEMCGIFDTCAGMFKTSYFKSAMNTARRYMPLFKWAIIGLSVFALLSVVEIRMFFAKAKNYLRYYIYASSGATLMLAVAPAAALIMKIGSRINFANASLYGLASGFINGIFVAMLYAAVVAAAITVLLIILRSVAVKKEQKAE